MTRSTERGSADGSNIGTNLSPTYMDSSKVLQNGSISRKSLTDAPNILAVVERDKASARNNQLEVDKFCCVGCGLPYGIAMFRSDLKICDDCRAFAWLEMENGNLRLLLVMAMRLGRYARRYRDVTNER